MSWLWRILAGASIAALSIYVSVWLSKQAPAVQQAADAPNTSASQAATGHGVNSGLRAGADAGVQPMGAASVGAEGNISPHPLSDALCPPNMNWVGGDYCPQAAVREDHCTVEPRKLSFCVDQFEYPNQSGVLPSVMVSFNEAAHYCKAEGKRLCSEGEWTFACRAPRRLSDCNFGQTSKRVHGPTFWDPGTVAAELERNEGRRPSVRTDCQSPWGVFDQLGNVQEWADSEHPAEYGGAIKGGRYNQSSIDCERSIQTRETTIRHPHTGFRCCSDPLVRIQGSL